MREAPAEALIRSRCMFGGSDWFRQGVAYIVDGAVTLSDGKGTTRNIPLNTLDEVRESLNFPAPFAERLHGFHFHCEGEALWVAMPDYLNWRPWLLNNAANIDA